jgi:hypothetical protein
MCAAPRKGPSTWCSKLGRKNPAFGASGCSYRGLEESTIIIEKLQDLYGMEVFHPSPADIESFRNKTRSVYAKWSEEIGVELVRSVEGMVARVK